MAALIPALADINIPPQVDIQVVDNLAGLVSEMNERSMMGYDGDIFFGAAFVQGSRLQFTTAMPMRTMLEISKVDRSSRHDTAKDVGQHANRPAEPTHSKQLRNYLLETACIGEKFILPSFTFNWGVDLSDDDPSVTLILHQRRADGPAAWPALLLIPKGAKLDTTDGAHRKNEANGINDDPKISQEKKTALLQNSVDVKIVFEESRADSHQDFADCGKAKALPKSLVTTFDVRDQRNKRAREMVLGSPFLAANVDATASFVNLSMRSKRMWSMTAVRQFISHVVERTPEVPADLPPGERTEWATRGAEQFFGYLANHMPQFRPLPDVTIGQLREQHGGDVALRGVAMLIFALAFLHCRQHKVDFETMAKRLGTLDWHLLDCDRDQFARDHTYAEEVRKHVQPLWSSLLILGESRYRISSKMADADAAWAKIVERLFPSEAQRIGASVDVDSSMPSTDALAAE